MNLYEKIACIKEEISKVELKKSGINKFAGFTYYELADFLPTIISLCKKYNVCTYTSFTNDLATLTAINANEPNERIEISSPMKELELKGCNQIQALGGVETYSRRYLYLAMFDIVEGDSFDATAGKDQPQPKAPTMPMITPAQLAVLKGLGVKTQKPLEQLTFVEAKKLIEQAEKVAEKFKKQAPTTPEQVKTNLKRAVAQATKVVTKATEI